jgi:hypothetical protein
VSPGIAGYNDADDPFYRTACHRRGSQIFLYLNSRSAESRSGRELIAAKERIGSYPNYLGWIKSEFGMNAAPAACSMKSNRPDQPHHAL